MEEVWGPPPQPCGQAKCEDLRLVKMYGPRTRIRDHCQNQTWTHADVFVCVCVCVCVCLCGGKGEIFVLQVVFFSVLQGVQLKTGPLTKPWIFHIRCCYDIILLHVQELARLLPERGEPVLAIRIGWISRQWVLVFEQGHFLRFHNVVNSGRKCIYFGKLF
jgi:hypothetical protein